MAKTRYKRTLLRATSPIEDMGYQLDETSRGTAIVDFVKFPVAGIRCKISFQLMQHFIAPVREFDVMLSRIRKQEYLGDETHYSHLVMNIPNLMSSIYRKDIFPEGKFKWAYTDEQTLLDEASHAVSLLVEYGINWLEDPQSNIEWIFKKDGNPRP